MTTPTITDRAGDAWELSPAAANAWLYGYAPSWTTSVIMLAEDHHDLAARAADELDTWDDLADKIHQSGYLSDWNGWEGVSEALLWQAVAAERAARTAYEAAELEAPTVAEDAYEAVARTALTCHAQGIAAIMCHRHVEGSGFAVEVARLWGDFAAGADHIWLSKDITITREQFLARLDLWRLATTIDAEVSA